MHLGLVHFDLRKLGMISFNKTNSFISDLFNKKWNDLIDNIFDVAMSEIQVLWFGKRKKCLKEVIEAINFFSDSMQIFSSRIVSGHLIARGLGGCLNPRERVS